jgi:hypothetical protein
MSNKEDILPVGDNNNINYDYDEALDNDDNFSIERDPTPGHILCQKLTGCIKYYIIVSYRDVLRFLVISVLCCILCAITGAIILGINSSSYDLDTGCLLNESQDCKDSTKIKCKNNSFIECFIEGCILDVIILTSCIAIYVIFKGLWEKYEKNIDKYEKMLHQQPTKDTSIII